MSAASVFMSSPPRPLYHEQHVLSSSSPYLPSLDEVFAKDSRPPLRSGSQAVPTLSNARTTFATAAEILREAPEIDIETEQVTQSPPRKPKTGRGRKKAAAPKPLDARPEEPVLIASESSQEKPWQKFKSNKSLAREKTGSEPPIPQGGVTKPKSQKRSRTKADTVSRHFVSNNSRTIATDGKTPSVETEPLEETRNVTSASGSCSEPALARRMDWTPPRSNNPILLDSEADAGEVFSQVDQAPSSKEVFQNLFVEYGRKNSAISLTPTELSDTEVFKKRRRIELVSVTGTGNNTPTFGTDHQEQPKQASPSKPPARKKKIKTITSLAIAPYAVLDVDLPGSLTADTLLNYFDTEGDVKALVEHQTAVMSPKVGEAKAMKKPVKPKRKKKAGTVEDPILLSPNSALKQSSHQDFIFGTSSQLVREDSPTTLRDLQVAIRASNEVDVDPFAESDNPGLWHAGARDADGDLLEIEVVDATSDMPTIRQEQPSLGEDFVDIDDILTSPAVASTTAKKLGAARPDKSYFFQSQATPSETQHPEPAASSSTTIEPMNPPRPKYELFTDAQLARQLTSYGFKPVKKRQAMVALLDQCWASKNLGPSSFLTNPISTSTAQSAPKKPSATASADTEKPKKPRGRPKKNPDKEVPTISPQTEKLPTPTKPRGRPKKTQAKQVEIADSDVDESDLASSISSHGDRIFSSPEPLDLSTSEEADMSLTLSPTEQEAHLFKHITRAVTSAPRSRDPSDPSWHEKMLLYDPVVLEELAAWLNGGQLTRVGYDGEVSPSDVKKWCESKSVICLWRKNLHGKERKRF